MRVLGTYEGFEIILAANKEYAPLTESNELNGDTVFSERKIYIRDDLVNAEKVGTLLHEIVGTYIEKWGMEYVVSISEKNCLEQFFSSMIYEILITQEKEFTSILSKLGPRDTGLDIDVVGEISGYKVKLCDEGQAETGVDFTECYGISDFDSRSIYLRSDVGIEEHTSTLCHELVHVFTERWGIYYTWSDIQREQYAQFFGSILKDVAIKNVKTIRKIIKELTK
jgi:hypothetical protein